MITQYEVRSLLADEIPALSSKAYPTNISLEIYTSINAFIDYTRDALRAHKYIQAKKCFILAENLYADGDQIVRYMIEYRFLNSFASTRSDSHVDDLIMKCIIPKTLYGLYAKQLNPKDN